MTSIGILGGGFGLYGYLPAAINIGLHTKTLSKYKEAVINNPALINIFEDIQFMDSEIELIEQSDAIVIARTPTFQFNFLRNLRDKSKFYFLEKPLAPTYRSHHESLVILETNSYKFSINYSFLGTVWFQRLKYFNTRHILCVTINWRIPTPKTPWKLDEFQGGGLYSYYALHFAPLLMVLGVDINLIKVVRNNSEIKILAKYNLDSLFEVNLSYSEKSGFDLIFEDRIVNKILLSEKLESPFGNLIMKGRRDPRIEGISNYLKNSLDSKFNNQAIMIENYVLKFRRILPEPPLGVR